jgi:hypothetical protein
MRRLQIWPAETLENIFWAIQTVSETAAPFLVHRDRLSETQKGFRCGFELGLQHIINLFKNKPPVQKVWTQKHLSDMLLAARPGMLIIAANIVKAEAADYNRGVIKGRDAALWLVALLFGVDLWSSPNGSRTNQASATILNPQPLFSQDVQSILVTIQDIWQTFMDASLTTVDSVAFTDGFEGALGFVAQSLGIELLSSALPLTTSFPFWQPEEIKEKLLLAYQEIPVAADDPQEIARLKAFWRGYKMAIHYLASSFGIILDDDPCECVALAA